MRETLSKAIFRPAIVVVLAGVCLTGAAAQAQTAPASGGSSSAAPAAITCTDLVIPVGGMPPGNDISITILPKDIVNQCTAPAGTTLTLVTSVNGVTIAASTDGPRTVSFTVKDAAGHQASANIIV